MFRIRRCIAALALLLTATLPTAAAPNPLLPGVGAQDQRVEVDGNSRPWSALVRLQIPGVSRCTAVLVAPHLALTAAHCLYSRRLGRFAPAASVHLLSHYASGDFTAHSVAASFRIAAGYDPARAQTPQPDDAALLRLATPMQADTLALAEAEPPAGTAAMLGGYSQDRSEIISADRACHVASVLGQAGLRHDCTATRGTSGAPMLVQDRDGTWRIVGIAVGAASGRNGGLAVGLAVLRSLLAAP